MQVSGGDESAAARTWRSRDDVELLTDQLSALDRWHERRRTAAEVVELRGVNRELQLDLRRRQRVRARQHEALLARAAVQLAEGARLLSSRAPRALVAHRHEWVRDRVAGELGRRGVDVIALVDDGADAVGVAVAEQPDLVLVEAALPSMSGVEVLGALREFCTQACLAAQGEQVEQLLAAGAVRAYPRRTAPVDIARDLALLVRSR